MHGLGVSCAFNFPNGNLKQQLSHIGVFICYQNIDAKNKLNLHINGIHLLNPCKTVVSHLKQMSSKTMKTICTFPIKHNSFKTKAGNPIDSRKSVGYFQAD